MRVLSKMIIGVVMIAACLPQPASGITVQEEEELAREFLKVALTNFRLIKDPYITGYVTKVGKKVLSVYPPQPFTYRFYVVKEDVYNAFASPGGNIFFNSGLIAAMENEDELAGILGHEISHVVCRHISEMIENSKKINIATFAGLAAGIFLGMGGAATAATAVTYGSLAAGQSAALAFSRDNERQADQVSLGYLEKAEYDAEGLLTMLQKIRSTNWFGSEQIPTYMVTHPATEERIAFIGSWIETHRHKGRASAESDQQEFDRMHTRLTALYGDANSELTRFKAKVDQAPGDAMAHYGYGLILSRTGNRRDAIGQFKKALEQYPFDQMIIKDLGKTHFLDGQYDIAVKLLEGENKAPYYDPEVDLFYGRAQTALGHPEKAVDVLTNLIVKRPNYSKAYYYLGEASGQLERTGDAHYYLGIYYIKQREWKNADFHLRTALAHLSDPDKKKKADDLLRKISGKGKKKKKAG